MGSNESNKAVVEELEDLTGLAFSLLRAIGQPEIQQHQRYLFYVPAIFKAVSLNADSVLRLHPLSVFYTEAGQRIYNPAALAALARMLLEACADLHYFAGRNVSEDEREFRCNVADIQRVRARINTGTRLDNERSAGKAPNLTKPDSQEMQQLARKNKLSRADLPNELDFWLTQVKGSKHFNTLPPAQQEEWLTGKKMKRHQCYGYALKREERALNAGIPAWVHKMVYGLLSEYTHTSASGIDRIYWFQPFDWVAIASQISLPMSFCCGFVAHAILEFAEIFPVCKSQLNTELSLLLDYWRGYITRPSAEPDTTEATF